MKCCVSELWVSLEEHQDALELIMSKYRKHMLQLMMKRKDVDAQPVLNVHQAQSSVRNYSIFLLSFEEKVASRNKQDSFINIFSWK